MRSRCRGPASRDRYPATTELPLQTRREPVPKTPSSRDTHAGRSARTVALDPETVDTLRQHRAMQILERDFAGPACVDCDLAFADALGGAIHPQRLTEWFAKHRKAAGIPSGSLHVLRHTAATIALTAGVPVHIVAARLGDDPKTILGVYAHPAAPVGRTGRRADRRGLG